MRRLCLLLVTLVAIAPASARADAHVEATGLTAGGRTEVTTGVPSAATAVLANVAMVNGAAPGYVTADRCADLPAGTQSRSNGNHGVGTAVSNLAAVAVTNGTFCIANQSAVDLVIDRQGWFGPVGSDPALTGGLAFTRDARRVLDTRTSGGSPVPAGSITRVPTGAAGASAVLVNLAMVDGAAAGYVTADRCSSLQPGPQARSNGNHPVGAAVSNLSVVPVDADGAFCVFNQTAVNLVIDLQGRFSTTGTDRFSLGTSRRLLDTRAGSAAPVPAGSITRVATGAAGASAVLVNLAMVEGGAPGYVTADRCSSLQPGPQARSNGNHPVGAAVSNLSVVPVDADGAFCVFNLSPVQLVIDLQGSVGPSGDQLLHLTDQTRVLDTRPPMPVETGRTSCTSVVHIGDSTSVGMISASVLKDPVDRIDAQYRRVGVTDPRMEISGARSIVERLPGQLNAFEVASAIESTGYTGCWVFALGTTDTANVAVGSDVSRRARIDKMMQLVNGDPVMWVTVRTLVGSDAWSNANMQLWNAELVAATSRYPNLRLYDWSAVADPAWFSSDRIHYTVDGYRIRARLIADALATTYPAAA